MGNLSGNGPEWKLCEQQKVNRQPQVAAEKFRRAEMPGRHFHWENALMGDSMHFRAT
jgi:hypothetical protein